MIYQIGNWEDTVAMKLAIDWTHPDAERGIREMSGFWAGHPDAHAPVEEHLAFFIEVMADYAYELSRTNRPGFHPAKIQQEVFSAEGFLPGCGEWLRLYDFRDDSASTRWEFTVLDEKETA